MSSGGTGAPTAERVLSTMNADGSRRWLKPKVSKGTHWYRRRIVAYGLIALFVVLPHLRVGGKPPFLLDIAAREFTLFGTVFYPTDTVALALLVLSVFVSIFLMTALFGRVWCGWACPQTVYLEFVYRPIERFFDGEPGKRRKVGAWRTPAKYGMYLVLSMLLAHTFLAYFVGTERLAEWVRLSPLEHPMPFFVMVFVTAMMMFDFSFFREQTCIVACPYGRFQSVMLDRNSLIVSYDHVRGEPRGRKKRRRARKGEDVSLKVVEPEPALGDCVDCTMCVQVCPTGIDIRDGLQLECVNCAQCIDACNDVMGKLGRDLGLIRYSSQNAIETKSWSVLRPRVVIYPLLLTVLVGLLSFVLLTKSPVDVTLLRGRGAPFALLGDGMVANQALVKLRNRTGAEESFTVTMLSPEGARVAEGTAALTIGPGELKTEPISILVPADGFVEGEQVARIRIVGTSGFEVERTYRLLGPWRAAGADKAQTGTIPGSSGDDD